MRGGRIFLFILLWFWLHAVQSQTMDRWWAFGNNTVLLQFQPASSNLTQSPITKLPLGSNEGCSSVIDPITSELMCYSNGIMVVDADHLVMPNGNGLLGHASSSQNGWIARVPGSCSKYFVFSNSCNFDNAPFGIETGSLYYSVIDLLLPGNGSAIQPLGDVVASQKNILIHNSVNEGYCVIHDPGMDRLLCYDPVAQQYRVYNITAGGMVLNSQFNSTSGLTRVLSIRPNTSGKIALTSHSAVESAFLLDYDANTGTILSENSIPGTTFTNAYPWCPMYDAEWSGDETKLYLTRYRQNATNGPGGQLLQYNLLTPSSPPQVIFQTSNNAAHVMAGMRRASDGRIYVLYKNSSSQLFDRIAYVKNPNNVGTSCNFSANVFQYNTDPGTLHRFPNYVMGSPTTLHLSDTIIRLACDQSGTLQIQLQQEPYGRTDSTFTWNIVSAGSTGTAVWLQTGGILSYLPSLSQALDTIRISLCDSRCLTVCDTAMILIQRTGGQTFITDIDTCLQDSMQLGIDPFYASGASVLWNTGSNSDSIFISSEGDYDAWVQKGNCNHHFIFHIRFLSTTENTFVPNIITPNGDGINDHFYLPELGDVDAFTIQIHDRWGHVVFSSSDPHFKWDGKQNGNPVADGVYFLQWEWVPACGGTQALQQHGFLHIQR